MASDYPRTTQVLKTFGLIHGSRWSEPKHARAGRYIHAGCALLAEGHEINDAWFQRTSGTGHDDTVNHADCIPKFQGFRKFLRDHPNFEFIASEQELIHTELGYVSHPDQLCDIDGKFTLLELKSGMEQDYHDLQVASYQVVAAFVYRRVPYPVKLYLYPDDYKLQKLEDQYRTTRKWLALMSAYKVLAEYKSNLLAG